ncbi:MAG: DUF89 domain-containing protein [Methanosarcinaceae archaeon]|nr:DUF89 domain-containing protein [Methanosarcinaceae archaeon]MDD4331706.1 DUF89 domain-containing protein [Methanosarcinaceae archaeon]MDD4749304.1 DUF89 domain-containing protein [Methanosarcinaceae archaeon]
MKMNPRCTYCLLSRIHFQAKLSTDDEELINRTIKECLKVLSENYSPEVVSASVATKVHRKCYEILNDNDPYRQTKKLSNEAALKLLPFAKEKIYAGNPDKAELFKRAVLASIIGNYFDFGIMGFDASEDRFEGAFKEHFERGLGLDETSKMLGMLDRVVYLTDNCGEIIFDMLLLEVIRKLGGKVTLVVRGGPILTDATLADVQEFGIENRVEKVLTTGSNAIGVSIEEAPSELLRELQDASLIISKGMANFETLSEHNFGPIAYLLLTKCECVAKELGVEKNLTVAKVMNCP